MEKKGYMKKVTVIGRIGEKSISKEIIGYQPQIPEQIRTVKKEIRQEFRDLGYDDSFVEFEIL